MQITYRNLDRISKRGRVRACLAFKPNLPAGHYETYVVVFEIIDKAGEVVRGPLRSHTGNIREFRSLDSVQSLLARWKLPGAYISILESSANQNRLEFLSEDDWKFILKSTDMEQHGQIFTQFDPEYWEREASGIDYHKLHGRFAEVEPSE